ncbi:ABC transporter permease [Pseudorhodoferax sp.]|uniref:ABC transporter permease n=1 Tax=Pseudorhodoferax sp. TaxID=1993553 RepID=UPI002DD63B7D|nr:ABC transporter permease [Pseudorhodoferax sp.]
MAAAAPVTTYPLRLAAPLAGFMLLFFLTPLAMLLFVSGYADAGMTQWGSLQAWAKMLDAFGLGVLADTLWLGLQVTALTLVLGYALAWTWLRLPPRLQPVVIFIVMLPLLTSVVVRTFAWIVILGRQGIVNATLLSFGWIDDPIKLLYTRTGLVVALANVQLPLMVLPLITALQRIDPNLADASASLGASAWRTFRRVTVPLSLPGVVAGCLLTFAAAITAFISQSLIGGGQMLFMPMYLYQQASSLSNYPFAAAIGLTFLVAVLLCVSAFNALGRLSRGYAQA